ncbi:MAG: TerB family tellurite resistance protein [Alphaproteobacteria bacterium]|nr:TerB family tellurite resistance protein [Alphaproteobacteria bacterium]
MKNKNSLLSLFTKFSHKNDEEDVSIQRTIQPQKGVLVAGISLKLVLKTTDNLGKTELFEALLRRVIKIKEDVFLDVLDIEKKAPKLVKISSIQEIKDTVRKVIFRNPYSFLLKSVGVDLENKPENFSQFSLVLLRTRPEITALTYLALIDGHRDGSEEDLILDYVARKCGDLKYNPEEVRTYIKSLIPDESCFYEAMLYLLNKENWEIKLFMETVIRLILSDGVVHKNEQNFLDELIIVLQNEGIDIQIG